MIHSVKKLNQEIKRVIRTGGKVGGISDTYHTFDELYTHRVALFIAFCNSQYNRDGYYCWKSKKHHDGSMFAGDWFIAGINQEAERQISYHLPLKYWDILKATERL